MNGNVEFKEMFLKDIEDNFNIRMKEQYLILFGDQQIGGMEKIFQKDIFDFTRDEILTAYKSLGASKLSSLASTHSLLNKYILYSFDKNMSKLAVPSTINITREDLEPLLSKLKLYKRYMTRSEIKRAMIELKNDQDRVLLILLFNLGIMGKDFCDIIDMRKEDFSYAEGYIKVKGQYYQLTDIDKEIIMDSIQEQEYSNYTTTRHETAPISNSPYIIRPTITRTTKVRDGEPIKPSTLRIRLNKIAKSVDKSEWSGKSIYVSGIVNRMLDIKDEWQHKDVLEYIKLNNYKLNAVDLQSVVEVIKEKIQNEQE